MFRSYREMKEDPASAENREIVRDALVCARRYDGSQGAFEKLMDALELMEEAIESDPTIVGSDMRDREAEWVMKYAPKSLNEVSDILDYASRRREISIKLAMASPVEGADMSLLTGEDTENFEGLGGLYVRRLKGVVLITDGGGGVEPASFGCYAAVYT